MRRIAVVVAVLAVAAPALADRTSYPEKLTKAEIAAAVKTVRDALVIDKVAVTPCIALHTESTAEQAAAAACFRKAGALSAAILLWKQVAQGNAASPTEIEDATRQLGPTFETAALYAEAASWHDTYARKYGTATDARARMIRAVCIWRQLDDIAQADRGFKMLRALRKQPRPDSATLCATVRPIVVPPPAKTAP